MPSTARADWPPFWWLRTYHPPIGFPPPVWARCCVCSAEHLTTPTCTGERICEGCYGDFERARRLPIPRAKLPKLEVASA